MNVLLLLLLLLSHGDEGPGICPVGLWTAAAAVDDGGYLDPYGRRVTATGGGAMDPNGHAGPIIDPNG